MTKKQNAMMNEAIELYGSIEPIRGRTWDGCFEDGKHGIIFWFMVNNDVRAIFEVEVD